VITELEAEEYLNPAGLGGTSMAGPTNMQARHAVRTGLVAHAVTFGVMALMLGLIHVAPLGATPETQTVIRTEGVGFVRIHAFPWARISIDGKEFGATPLADPIELPQGKHTIKFVHDWYAPKELPVEIQGGTSSTARPLSVNFCKEGTLRSGKTAPAGSCEVPQ
jgi:hypothetical protein